MSKRTVATVAGVVIVVALAVTVVWVRWSASEDERTSRWSPVAAGVCAATRRAEQGDHSGARQVFYDSVHQGLHTLARSAAARDRATAARLLEDMDRVERTLEEPTGALTRELRILFNDVGRAAEVADNPISGTCRTRP